MDEFENIEILDDNSKETSNRLVKKPKLDKGRPKQSFVWNHFNIIDDFNYCRVDVPISVKNPEGICNHKIKNGLSTTNMINHLSKVHKIYNPTEEEKVNKYILSLGKFFFKIITRVSLSLSTAASNFLIVGLYNLRESYILQVSGVPWNYFA